MPKSIVGLHDEESVWEQASEDFSEEIVSVEFFAAREYVLGLPPVGEEDHGASQGTNEELHNGRIQLGALKMKPICYCLVGRKMPEHTGDVSKQTVGSRLVIGDARDGSGEGGTVGKIE